MSTTYTIFCVLLGETTPFSVDIASNKTASHLKDAIKEKKPNRFAGVDADELALYHVDISGSIEAMVEQLKMMADDVGHRNALIPFHELTDIYSTAPPKRTIHVLVQPPQTKRAGTGTDSKSNVHAIVGGTVGGVILGILILAIIVVIIIRRNRRNQRVDDGVGQKRYLPGKDTELDGQALAMQMNRTRGPLGVITSSTARRDVTFDALYQRLNRYRLVMVRGTPASGKTILAQLLADHIRTQEPEADPILISSWPRDGSRWSEKLTTEYKRYGPNIIIIDEAQLTYWDTAFWNNFLKPTDLDSLDRIILFARYGTPSGPVSAEGTSMIIPDLNRVSLRPVDHDDGIASAGLFLTADEFADMVKKRHPEGCFKEDFLDYVFRVTAGHTGAVSDLLRIVSADDSFIQVKRDSVEYSFDIFQREFPMHKLWSSLNSCNKFRHGLPTSEKLQVPSVARVLRAVLNENHVTEKMLNSPEDRETLAQCFKSGWLHVTTNTKEYQYIFTTQLHQWFIDYYLGTNIQDCTLTMVQDTLDFAIDVIKLFCTWHLSSPRRIGASNKQRPPEAQFQDEFYRCCHRYSNGSLISFPEFGDGKGRADFYIPLKRWGVEVLRDGDGLENHSPRFIVSGAYTKMKLKDYIILDFCKVRPTKGHPGIQNLYHVVFKDDDYKHVEIQKGSSLETVVEFELFNS